MIGCLCYRELGRIVDRVVSCRDLRIRGIKSTQRQKIDRTGEVDDLTLEALRMIKHKRLQKKTLITTIMSNMGLDRALENAGGKTKRTSVGDRYVVEEMRRGGYNFGGEQSGHLIFLEHATTGDGTVAALQVIAIMLQESRPLSELSKVMQRVPQVLESVKLPARLPLDKMPELGKRIQLAEKKLGKNGRVVVRWSGTEAKLRLMVEGPDPAVLKTLVAEMTDAAKKDVAAVG